MSKSRNNPVVLRDANLNVPCAVGVNRLILMCRQAELSIGVSPMEEPTPTFNEERNPRNQDGDWVKRFAAFSISVTLFVAVLVVANRYPSAGQWISDIVQAEVR